ncbi:hypothetical protein ACJMK2_004512 [Sinanodonta woodiana]|uniref:Transmembrane and coiled-coil domains protein 1 n=1 Tax=Sinanodonta woodiana TaxID=1069815 RepID=A0ABD3Y1E7_SINWO
MKYFKLNRDENNMWFVLLKRFEQTSSFRVGTSVGSNLPQLNSVLLRNERWLFPLFPSIEAFPDSLTGRRVLYFSGTPYHVCSSDRIVNRRQSEQVAQSPPKSWPSYHQDHNGLTPRKSVGGCDCWNGQGPNILHGGDSQGMTLYQLLRQQVEQPEIMRKSESGRIPALKLGAKKPSAKSPNLKKKHSSPELLMAAGSGSGSTKSYSSAATLQVPEESTTSISHSQLSAEELERVEVCSRDNGSGGSEGFDDFDARMVAEGNPADSARTQAAIETMEAKIVKTMESIKKQQELKEANVNEYLKLSVEADSQQLQKNKATFEKKNQKSTQIISHLQKKLETYHKKLKDYETYGVTHRQAKEVLKDMGQGLMGVVGNIKGAKDTIVSKPREIAHLIKNKFGSADNIPALKATEETSHEDTEKAHPVGGTLPASFKYNSEEDNSSITSGSGFGAHVSPQSTSQAALQQIVISETALESLLHEITELKEVNSRLQEMLQRYQEDSEMHKNAVQIEISGLRGMFDDDKFKMDRLEEQMNDITELHQHEVVNLRQDIASMEEKLEYRLDERTTDIHDLLENCQTRITKMELQQQQQQIISMEMVENVTFRTILTKLLNVALAILAVILVFVSTAANLISPFLKTRARILSTSFLIFSIVMTWQHWTWLMQTSLYTHQYFLNWLYPT